MMMVAIPTALKVLRETWERLVRITHDVVAYVQQHELCELHRLMPGLPELCYGGLCFCCLLHLVAPCSAALLLVLGLLLPNLTSAVQQSLLDESSDEVDVIGMTTHTNVATKDEATATPPPHVDEEPGEARWWMSSSDEFSDSATPSSINSSTTDESSSLSPCGPCPSTPATSSTITSS